MQQGGMVTSMPMQQQQQPRMQMQIGAMQPMDPSQMQQARMMRQMRPQQGNLRQVKGRRARLPTLVFARLRNSGPLECHALHAG